MNQQPFRRYLAAVNIRPALCSPMDFDQACYWQGEGWVVEEKKDGVRCLVHVGEASVATGRRLDDAGRVLPLSRQQVAQEWHQRLQGCVVDGELMADGTFWAFDLPVDRGVDIRRRPLRERKAALRALADWLPAHAKILPWFTTVRALGDFDEGVVWKHLGDRYGGDWLKGKRTVTVDLVVDEYEGNGVVLTKGRGRVQGCPEDLKRGDLIECVAYGVHASGKLKSGRFLRVRTDK